MTNVTPLSNINYDAILHELTKPRDFDIDAFLRTSGASLASALSEMNTIWIGAGRQRGKTQWIASLLESEPSSIAISVNLGLKTLLLKKLSNTFDESRLFTEYNIRTPTIPLDEQIPLGVKWVIVDDAMFVLERIKRKVLFEWIAHHGSKHTRVVMVTN